MCQIRRHILFLLGQSPVFIVEFFVVPKNETLKTNKPPAMRVESVRYTKKSSFRYNSGVQAKLKKGKMIYGK